VGRKLGARPCFPSRYLLSSGRSLSGVIIGGVLQGWRGRGVSLVNDQAGRAWGLVTSLLFLLGVSLVLAFGGLRGFWAWLLLGLLSLLLSSVLVRGARVAISSIVGFQCALSPLSWLCALSIYWAVVYVARGCLCLLSVLFPLGLAGLGSPALVRWVLGFLDSFFLWVGVMCRGFDSWRGLLSRRYIKKPVLGTGFRRGRFLSVCVSLSRC